MVTRTLLPIVLCILFAAGCRDFITQSLFDDPPQSTTPSEPTCSLEGEIVFYQSQECFCCPGYKITFDDRSIFVSDLGNPDVEHIVQNRIWNNELPIKITFSYDEPDTQCVNHQYLTCIELK